MTPRTSAGANYWPTGAQELCLEAALLRGEAALTAWRRLALASDPGRLDAASLALLPLVYRNLVALGAEDDELETLKLSYLRTWAGNQRLFQAVLPLVHALEQAGIEVIVLKGLALIASVYGDPGLRPMADADVLVPRPDVERAARVAQGLRWTPRHRLTPAFRRVKHGEAFDDDSGVVCDVHWRVFEEAGGEAADDEFRADARSVVFQGTRLRVLSPTDLLLHVCGHAGKWSIVPGIRWVADATLILRASPIDWDRVVRHAVTRRFVLRMREMLGYLRDRLDADIPRAVEAELARRPVSLLERLEYRVRSREQRLLGELPTYVFNCLRGEPRPLVALPGYLRDAWELPSLTGVPGRAVSLAARRLRAAGRGLRSR